MKLLFLGGDILKSSDWPELSDKLTGEFSETVRLVCILLFRLESEVLYVSGPAGTGDTRTTGILLELQLLNPAKMNELHHRY